MIITVFAEPLFLPKSSGGIHSFSQCYLKILILFFCEHFLGNNQSPQAFPSHVTTLKQADVNHPLHVSVDHAAVFLVIWQPLQLISGTAD